ncbi:MAG TPA: L-threonylcarbamoyladenylate synthase [Woeseiaceae bacterium]|nr:L-threonylcarbamoyladenylate synthase [Woeseiaceae bacterium]
MRPWIKRAVDTLLNDGVIAYPTEGVFGLGCLPDNEHAIRRLLDIKQRDAKLGLILIAANTRHLQGWVADDDLARLPPPDVSLPISWVVSAGDRVTPLISGKHRGVAVRITSNPVAREICTALQSPLTSTSANLSGKAVVRNKWMLHRTFGTLVDYIVPGDCGPASGPSEIRDLGSGRVIRPRIAGQDE